MKFNLLIILSFLFIHFIYDLSLSHPFVTQADSITIADQLNSIFSETYNVFQIINVDQVENSDQYYQGSIHDPYGTLNNSLLFLAHQQNLNFQAENGIVGVFKNGQIIWHSNEIIKPKCTAFGQILATMDLLNSNNIEIITWWSDCISGVGGRYLWIFSWDGQAGSLINDRDKNGNSVITTDQYSDFEFVDVEGDGIWEIEASGYTTDEENGIESIPFYYSWNGELYGLWTNTPVYNPDFFPPRDKVNIKLYTKVTKFNSFNLKYHYYIKNETLSIQKINEIVIEKDNVNIKKISKKPEWYFIVHDNELHFLDKNEPPTSYSTKYRISQGETDSSFIFSSYALPSIRKYFVRGYNKSSDNDEYQEPSVNSKKGLTIAPSSPPDPFIPSIFADSLINYKHKASDLGWIGNKGTINSLDKKLENAQKQLYKGNHKSAENILNAFLNELEALYKNHLVTEKNGKSHSEGQPFITEEAYALLKYNVEYLIQHLEK